VSRATVAVAEVRAERGRVWTLVLEPADGGSLRFAPGQFAWLSLRASPFAMREHPFSIASSAERPTAHRLVDQGAWRLHVDHQGRQVGETRLDRRPYGTFGIDEHPGAAGYVFIAGGIGIAPIMSMLRTLADRGDRRPLLLFYGNRAWERVAFREELEALAQRLDLRVVHVLLEPPADWRATCRRPPTASISSSAVPRR
jgi:predicted ferric reductase